MTWPGAATTATSAPKARARTAAHSAPDAGIAAKVLGLVNAERGKLGLPPLALSDALGLVAQGHTNDMVQRGYYGYSGPDGQGLEGRMQGSGYAGRTGANLTSGHSA